MRFDESFFESFFAGIGKFFILALLFLAAVPAESQENNPAAQAEPAINADSRLLLALSTADYPATPGDVYNLYFNPMAGNPIVIQLALDARYQLRILNMGNLNGKGKTYLQLKSEAENLVARNYPLSGPSLTLHRIGKFNVTVTGETLHPGNRAVDGLTRASALLAALTGKASIRFVQVTSADKTVRIYDTFAAARTGDFFQDPYIRPGDQVYIPVARRIVQIGGEVFRPGKYELLPGEGLPELVEKYGGGLTPEAVPGKISITRLDYPAAPTRSLINLPWDTRQYISLTDRDIVTVPNKDSNRQAVFFEGAVFAGTGNTENTETGGPDPVKAVPRIPYYFYPGEKIGNASRNIRQCFTEVSDLAQAYILRNGGRLPVNLERHLYFNDDSADILLYGGDIIVIPYRQHYTITGEVAEAGDKPLTSLARLSSLMTGLTEKASNRLVTVTSAGGSSAAYDLFRSRRFGDLSQNPYIRPGDKIHVPAAGRRVTAGGEVSRPGEYELLPGEELSAAIEYYAGGFTLDAAPGRITLSRTRADTAGPREVLYLSWDKDRSFVLADGDRISVANKDINRQAVFFEGAVFFIADNNEVLTRDREEANKAIARIPYYFSPGETLGNASRNIRRYFTEVSDLAKAYILRDNSEKPVDLERHLYFNDDSGDIPLQNGDVIVIPYRQYYTITGEVAEAGDKPLTSLARLSSLMTGLTEKASNRLVTVTSAGGSSAAYDLFRSRRFGDLSQNPYIRPGDKIHVPAAGRRVTIGGEVFRPGEYELLPGEELSAAIEYYAGGFTLAADPDRIGLARINTPENIPGESKIFPYKGNEGLALEDRDAVSVGNKIENRPVVFFEGAISATGRRNVEETSAVIEGTALLEYPFYKGETLGNAVRAIRSQFIASSDLANTYMIRSGKNIPVDLNQFLYRQDFSSDFALENGDTIIIPFHQYFVLVTGAVKAPGRYPYIPERMADYYINLAGGRDDLLNNGRGTRVTDMNNRKLPASSVIAPETMIDIPTNRFSARFNQYGPIITTILSIITTTISILAVTGRF